MELKTYLKLNGFFKGDFDWKLFLKKQIPYGIVLIGIVLSVLIGLPEETAVYGIPITLIITSFKNLENILKHIKFE